MKKFIFILAVCCLVASAAGAQTPHIEQLAGNHTLVRISASEQSKFLMLPIEEKAPEADVKIICGNDLVRNLRLHLAMDKVDYLVPLCLDEWRGEEVKLLVHMTIDRSNGRDIQNEICWSRICFADSFDKENREVF
ncbi:MAG: DUF4980 domain-containing protein, partial [Candidatus Cryptobacteroides sp.]